MEWLMSIWNFFPNELKLMIFTALPGIGKGLLSIPYGMCKFNLPMETVVFWCALGSSIKVLYYFTLIYGAEKWFIRKGFLSAQKFEKWIEKARSRHKNLFECLGIISLIVVPNIGAGILPCACVAYIFGVRFFLGIFITILGTTFGTYMIALGTFHSKSIMVVYYEAIIESGKILVDIIKIMLA